MSPIKRTGESHGSVMLNVRVRRDDGRAMTKRELAEVLDSVREHERVPDGYALARIEWMNPEKGDVEWRRGEVEDLSKFGPLLRKMSKSELLENFRAAEVDKAVPLSFKDVKRRDELAARADSWRAKRHREIVQIGRLKTKQARSKHAKLAERYRRHFERAADELENLDYPDGREYELAVEYEGKKGRRK